MSYVNWHHVDFNLTALPFHAWTETILLAANNLLNFILTSIFGDGYIFCDLCHKGLVSYLTTSYFHDRLFVVF